MRPLARKLNPAILMVMRNWKIIVGESFYKYCEPLKISFRPEARTDGVLYMDSFNSAASFHVEHNKIFILEKANSLFGYNAISRIVIRQNPKIIAEYEPKRGKTVGQEALESLRSSIDEDMDEELASSLLRLGRAVLEFGKK